MKPAKLRGSVGPCARNEAVNGYEFQIPTRWGLFTGMATARGIRSLCFPPASSADASIVTGDGAIGALDAIGERAPMFLPQQVQAMVERLQQELRAFLAGKCDRFTVEPDLPQRPEFYASVWASLRTVPYGQTVTYAQLAALAGRPAAARACGQACGANPVPLLVPCHRVLATGGLGGFSPGADWKIRLLELEAR